MKNYNELINFKIAKLAKEKNFNEITELNYISETNPVWKPETLIDNVNCLKHSDGDNHFYSAPSKLLLQKWLRENHNIHVVIIPSIVMKNDWEDEIEYYYSIYTYDGIISSKGIETFSPEIAFEKGLEKGLKLIK